MIRLKVYLTILFALSALLLGAVADSRLRCRSDARLRALRIISPLLPSADPGVDTSARYIRHLGLTGPGSAFQDFPAQPDYLPSGMMWPPLRDFVGLSGRIPLAGGRKGRK